MGLNAKSFGKWQGTLAKLQNDLDKREKERKAAREERIKQMERDRMRDKRGHIAEEQDDIEVTT